MRITVVGLDPPGRRFVSEGVALANVHVAVQVGADPLAPVPADVASARWDVDVRVAADSNGEVDVRGPAVHGRRGERFLYVTWGEVGLDGCFTMFRRAKLMLADAGPLLAEGAAGLVVEVDLTDDRGGPRAGRVRPPAVRWSPGD